MATVPRYGVPQVTPENLPNVRISDKPARDIAAVGAAMSQGLSSLAQAAQGIAEAERRKADSAAQFAAENALDQLESKTLYDPEHGARARKGEAALNLTQSVLPEWDRAASTIVNGAPRHLQTWVQERAKARRAQVERQLMEHSLKEGNAHLMQQAQSLQSNAQNLALVNYRDPKRVDEEIARGMVAVDRSLDLVGADEATRQNLRAAFVSQTQRKVIERTLTDDPLAARTLLSSVRERLTGEDQAALDQQMSAIEQDLQGDEDADWALEGGRLPSGDLFAKSDGKAAPAVPRDVRAVVEAAADRHGVPRALALALAQQESGFNVKAQGPQTQWGRAKGLYQFLDSTAASLRIDPLKPEQAADAAMRQLSAQAKAKGWDWAIAHHFAGPDPKLHGPRTATYVRQVKEKARRFNEASPTDKAPDAVAAHGPAVTLSDALARVQKIADPRRRRVAEQKVRDRFELQELAERERAETILETISSKIEEADPRLAAAQVLSPQELGWLRAKGKLDTFENRLRQRRSGLAVQDDPLIVETLYNEALDQPGAFKKRSLTQYADRLSPRTRAELMRMQKEVGQPKAQEDWANVEQRVASGVRTLGYDRLKGDAAKQRHAEFAVAYRQARRALVESLGPDKKPTPQQEDALLASVVKDFIGTRDKAGAQSVAGREALSLESFSAKVPAETMAAARSRLRVQFRREPSTTEVLQYVARAVESRQATGSQ